MKLRILGLQLEGSSSSRGKVDLVFVAIYRALQAAGCRLRAWIDGQMDGVWGLE